jgi:hypothetical protein
MRNVRKSDKERMGVGGCVVDILQYEELIEGN